MAARRRPTFVGKRDRSRCPQQTQFVTDKGGSWTGELAFMSFAQGSFVRRREENTRAIDGLVWPTGLRPARFSMNYPESAPKAGRAPPPLDSPSVDWHSSSVPDD